MDILDWSEAAKNLMSSISGILSSTGAATLQVVTPKRKPRMSMQAKGLNLREEKRRQTSVDVKALKQALEAKGEHSHVKSKPRQTIFSWFDISIAMRFCIDFSFVPWPTPLLGERAPKQHSLPPK